MKLINSIIFVFIFYININAQTNYNKNEYDILKFDQSLSFGIDSTYIFLKQLHQENLGIKKILFPLLNI